jgi:hypothetical protein
MSSIEWRGWSRKAVVGALAAAATFGVWWRRRRDAGGETGAEGLAAATQVDGESASGAVAEPVGEPAPRAGRGQ